MEINKIIEVSCDLLNATEHIYKLKADLAAAHHELDRWKERVEWMFVNGVRIFNFGIEAGNFNILKITQSDKIENLGCGPTIPDALDDAMRRDESWQARKKQPTAPESK